MSSPWRLDPSRPRVSNKRPVTTPEDMKGQTIRVQESPTYVAMMKAMGANPVPMPYVERIWP